MSQSRPFDNNSSAQVPVFSFGSNQNNGSGFNSGTAMAMNYASQDNSSAASAPKRSRPDEQQQQQQQNPLGQVNHAQIPHLLNFNNSNPNLATFQHQQPPVQQQQQPHQQFGFMNQQQQYHPQQLQQPPINGWNGSFSNASSSPAFVNPFAPSSSSSTNSNSVYSTIGASGAHQSANPNGGQTGLEDENLIVGMSNLNVSPEQETVLMNMAAAHQSLKQEAERKKKQAASEKKAIKRNDEKIMKIMTMIMTRQNLKTLTLQPDPNIPTCFRMDIEPDEGKSCAITEKYVTETLVKYLIDKKPFPRRDGPNRDIPTPIELRSADDVEELVSQIWSKEERLQPRKKNAAPKFSVCDPDSLDWTKVLKLSDFNADGSMRLN